MDLVDLVKLIVSWEERVQGYNFEEHAAYPPNIHLVAVVPIGKQTLWSSIPPRAYVLCVRLLTVDASTTAEVGELDAVVHDEDILRFNVSVENTVFVHMVNGLQQLKHIVFHPILR